MGKDKRKPNDPKGSINSRVDMPEKAGTTDAREFAKENDEILILATRMAKNASAQYRKENPDDKIKTDVYDAKDYIEQAKKRIEAKKDIPEVKEENKKFNPEKPEFSFTKDDHQHKPSEGEEEAWQRGESKVEETEETQEEYPHNITPQNKKNYTHVPKNLQPESHPILDDLRNTFGLTKIKTIKRDIGGKKWIFRKISSDDADFATSLAATGALSEREFATKYIYAKVCCGIAGIEHKGVDTPVYEFMGMDTGDTTIVDSFNPPREIKREATSRLFDLLRRELEPDLFTKLGEAYNIEFDEDINDEVVKITSYLDEMIVMTLKCNDCNREENNIPEFIDKEKTKVKSIYCRNCGKEMKPVSTTNETEDVPLE